MVKSIKEGELVVEKRFNDKTTLSNSLIDMLLKLAAARGMNLARNQIAMLRIPNSPAVLTCYAWLHNYFNLVGDNIPNSAGEIHLEPIEIKEVWKEYKDDMEYVHESVISCIEFGCLWSNCYPHVKIREYKAVTGSIVFSDFGLHQLLTINTCDRKVYYLRPVESCQKNFSRQ